MPLPISDQKRREILTMYGAGVSSSQIAQRVGVCRKTVLRTIAASKKMQSSEDNENKIESEIDEVKTNARNDIDNVELPLDLGDFAKKTLIYNLESLFQLLAKVQNVPGAYGQVTAEITIRKEIRMTAAQIGQWAGLGKEAEVGNAILSEFSKKYLNQPLDKSLKFEE